MSFQLKARDEENNSKLKMGSLRPISQLIVSNNPTRKTIANPKPMFLALFCWSFGSLSDNIEMKMMLSTPKTISKKVRVNKLIHT